MTDDDRLDPGEQFLCDTHSKRMTRPSDCQACANVKKITLLRRRVAELEDRNETLEARLTALEADGEPESPPEPEVAE